MALEARCLAARISMVDSILKLTSGGIRILLRSLERIPQILDATALPGFVLPDPLSKSSSITAFLDRVGDLRVQCDEIWFPLFERLFSFGDSRLSFLEIEFGSTLSFPLLFEDLVLRLDVLPK